MSQRQSLLVLATVTAVCGFSAEATARNRHHDHDRIEGSGKLETRDFDLRGWHDLRLDGSMDIEVRIGAEHAAHVTLDDNLFANLVLEVQDGTLVVDWRDECDAGDDTKLALTVPALTALEINGAGDVDVAGLAGGNFGLRVRGAGDVDLAGRVDALDIRVDGAGDVDADALTAKDVEVEIAGAGDVDVTASGSFDGAIRGVGDISYGGDPAQVTTKVSGIGGIHKR
ncbi:MAG: head GIN domain-containing protein [bacterium]|nr:head GIN domain-containing protein [bacterium]